MLLIASESHKKNGNPLTLQLFESAWLLNGHRGTIVLLWSVFLLLCGVNFFFCLSANCYVRTLPKRHTHDMATWEASAEDLRLLRTPPFCYCSLSQFNGSLPNWIAYVARPASPRCYCLSDLAWTWAANLVICQVIRVVTWSSHPSKVSSWTLGSSCALFARLKVED